MNAFLCSYLEKVCFVAGFVFCGLKRLAGSPVLQEPIGCGASVHILENLDTDFIFSLPDTEAPAALFKSGVILV